jgi:hypothetical protein
MSVKNYRAVSVFAAVAILAGVCLYTSCPDKKDDPVTYTVTFDENGGDTKAVPDTMTVTTPARTLAALPEPPTREEYNFGGWRTPDYKTFNTKTVVNKDITVKARWVFSKENFHIYLCFGQSNMEGYIPSGGSIPASDKVDVSGRFQVLASVDMPALGRTKGNWYTAVPPLARGDTGLTPADYFGRTMVEGIDDPNVKVGVIVVAVAGCAINMFDPDNAAALTYLNAQQDWMKAIAAQYDNNPYQRLVDMAKIAQETGVIKGILLHQGESGKAGSNNQNGSDDANWGKAVKGIYEKLLEDLDLEPNSIPLLAGQVVGNGSDIIKNLPKVMPGIAYVIPSNGCTAAGPSGNDAIHFSYEGYRELGKRYGEKMLELLGAE